MLAWLRAFKVQSPYSQLFMSLMQADRTQNINERNRFSSTCVEASCISFTSKVHGEGQRSPKG